MGMIGDRVSDYIWYDDRIVNPRPYWAVKLIGEYHDRLYIKAWVVVPLVLLLLALVVLT